MSSLALPACISRSLVSSSDAPLPLQGITITASGKTEKNTSSIHTYNVQKLQRTSNAVSIGAWIFASLKGKALSAWNFWVILSKKAEKQVALRNCLCIQTLCLTDLDWLSTEGVVNWMCALKHCSLHWCRMLSRLFFTKFCLPKGKECNPQRARGKHSSNLS